MSLYRRDERINRREKGRQDPIEENFPNNIASIKAQRIDEYFYSLINIHNIGNPNYTKSSFIMQFIIRSAIFIELAKIISESCDSNQYINKIDQNLDNCRIKKLSDELDDFLNNNMFSNFNNITDKEIKKFDFMTKNDICLKKSQYVIDYKNEKLINELSKIIDDLIISQITEQSSGLNVVLHGSLAEYNEYVNSTSKGIRDIANNMKNAQYKDLYRYYSTLTIIYKIIVYIKKMTLGRNSEETIDKDYRVLTKTINAYLI